MSHAGSDWMRMVRRLEASYALGGREALAKMTGVEAYLLYEEKAAALMVAEKHLTEHPKLERWVERRNQLRTEVADIEGWLKQHVWPSNERQPSPERSAPPVDAETVRRMLADVEAVTKSRFSEDPEPIASPIEMLRMPDGKPGGEPFAALSAGEKLHVLDYYANWPNHEKQGVSWEQKEHVYANVIAGKPRQSWLEGTGLSLSEARNGEIGLGTLDDKQQRAEVHQKLNDGGSGGVAPQLAGANVDRRNTLERMKKGMPAAEASQEKHHDHGRQR